MDITVNEDKKSTTIALKGRFDFQSHQEFRRTIEGLLRAGRSSLTLDMSELSFIDSSALGMLLLARESCERAGGAVVLERPQEYVDKVLRLCHFDLLFQVTR
jgi:anti-anti-sigma factor